MLGFDGSIYWSLQGLMLFFAYADQMDVSSHIVMQELLSIGLMVAGCGCHSDFICVCMLEVGSG